jgi:AbrB family looped-hinge helix DNA binding protein
MAYYVIYWRISMKIEGIQARINQNGRIVIPAVIRKGMGLELGDSVIMSLEDGTLLIEPLRARVGSVQSAPKKIAKPGNPASGDLERERCEESQTEKEEWLG